MKKKVIAVGVLPEGMLERLRTAFDLTEFDGKSPLDGDPAFLASLAAAQGVLCTGMAFTRELIAHAKHLEVVSAVSVGYDNYDLRALSARGILLCNTPDVLTESVADLALALMLGVARRIPELAGLVRSGGWTHSLEPTRYGVDVHGRRLGILGMGRIGAAIAQRAHGGFGMKILYHGRSAKPEIERRYAARFGSLDAVLAESDFVCVVLPLTLQTANLISAREFGLMQRSAYLINVSRGAIVDEPALVQALRSGEIAGAGLDVFAKEPLAADSPLLTMANVLALPHIGSATRDTREAMAQLAADNLIEALAGRPAPYPVNPEVLGPC